MRQLKRSCSRHDDIVLLCRLLDSETLNFIYPAQSESIVLFLGEEIYCRFGKLKYLD
jgi:hypothetical protein